MKKYFYLKALRTIEKGEELTIKYGNIANINLFVNYGIVVKNNYERSGVVIRYNVNELINEDQMHWISKKHIEICLRWIF